ncbi:DUF4245 domain-containing protein [Streptomyces sp. NPDC050560]|uniref:DUF4245 domain-containing protein n=1 Tax=Streptomyces sp. NPDC050560 TaxID=3365630 RepID=UPI0037B67300
MFDMVLSLGAILIVAFVVYLFIPHDDHEPPVKRIDYSVELLTARRAAPYPVAAPEGLPHAWKPTVVRYDGAEDDTWHLGFQDPKGEYVAVEQSTEDPASFVEDVSQGARRTDATQRIGDQVWRRYEGAKYDALVLPGKKATTVVTGTASFQRLAEMAGALKAEAADPAGSASP